MKQATFNLGAPPMSPVDCGSVIFRLAIFDQRRLRFAMELLGSLQGVPRSAAPSSQQAAPPLAPSPVLKAPRWHFAFSLEAMSWVNSGVRWQRSSTFYGGINLGSKIIELVSSRVPYHPKQSEQLTKQPIWLVCLWLVSYSSQSNDETWLSIANFTSQLNLLQPWEMINDG